MRLAVCAALALATSAAQSIDDYRLLRLDGHLVKWGSSSMGTPAAVTYAYVSERMEFPAARNCRAMVPLDGLLAASAIPPERFVRETEEAFRTWEIVAGIRFQRSDTTATADILIGAQATPRGVAFADVAHSPSGARDVRSIERASICLNPTEPWRIGVGGSDGAYDVRHVITHEAGHTIGLDHPGGDRQLMSFRYPPQVQGLQAGDIAGVARLYGEAMQKVPAPPAGQGGGRGRGHPRCRVITAVPPPPKRRNSATRHG